MSISAIQDETQLRDGDTDLGWAVRAEGSSWVASERRLRHDNIWSEGANMETFSWFFEWSLKCGAVLLGPVSTNNKQDQSSPAWNINIL